MFVTTAVLHFSQLCMLSTPIDSEEPGEEGNEEPGEWNTHGVLHMDSNQFATNGSVT